MITGTQWLVLILSLGAVFSFVFLIRRAAYKQLKDRDDKKRAEHKRR